MPLRATIAALCAPALVSTVMATPAHAALQATYEQVCPTYTHLPKHDLEIRDGSTLLGVLMIGMNWGNGRMCLATIKNDRVQRDTIASIVSDSGNNVDRGLYYEYAGEPCTYPPPKKCSAIYARNQTVEYWGRIDNGVNFGHIFWGNQ